MVVVGETRLYCESVAAGLRGRLEFDVLSGSTAVSTLIAIRDAPPPDVVLLDMRDLKSIDALRALTDALPTAKVVALAVPEEEAHVIACAEAGIAGYLPQNKALDELVDTIRRVARGEAICSPRITATLLRRVAELAAGRPAEDPRETLTSRELEVVALIDRGLSNKQIARELVIELPTVKNHVHNVLEKLQVDRRADAAARVRGSVLAHARLEPAGGRRD